ncbi:hypothetical protein Agub_g8075, partial [Astrephomene gubernaculifera]
ADVEGADTGARVAVEQTEESEGNEEEDEGEERRALPLGGGPSLSGFLAVAPLGSFTDHAAGSCSSPAAPMRRSMSPLAPPPLTYLPTMRVAFAAAAADEEGAGSPATPSACAPSACATSAWGASPMTTPGANSRDAKKHKGKLAKAFKVLFKKGGKEGAGQAGEMHSSVALSIGAPSTLAGMSEAASALERAMTGMDALSFAGTSDTGMTHGSAMTDPQGEYGSAASKERRRRKGMWKRMKRKLGKLMGIIPRSWEVEAMRAQEAAAAATAAGAAAGPLAAGVADGQGGEAGAASRGRNE